MSLVASKEASLALLTKYSNVLQLCNNYNISTSELESITSDNDIEFKDVSIHIDPNKILDKMQLIDWNNVTGQVNETMKEKIKSDDNIKDCFAVVVDLNKLTNVISNAVIEQLKEEYNCQGYWTWFTNTSVKCKIHFVEIITTTDKNKGNTEYLEVTGDGTIKCEQKIAVWGRTNEVKLNLNIHFRAIMLLFETLIHKRGIKFIEPNGTERKVTAPELLCEFKWSGNKHQSIQI
jgi:hypothetical protein